MIPFIGEHGSFGIIQIFDLRSRYRVRIVYRFGSDIGEEKVGGRFERVKLVWLVDVVLSFRFRAVISHLMMSLGWAKEASNAKVLWLPIMADALLSLNHLYV